MLRWLVLMMIATAPLAAQDDVRRGFDQLAQAHPTHLKVEALGKQGSFVAVLRDQSVKSALPAIVLIGSVHGVERAPAEACLLIARNLLEDKGLRDWFSRCELLIIPVPNPDGRRGNTDGVPLPFDDDRDGKTDEDGPSDLNADGSVSQMRVRRKGGAYVASEADPRILLPVQPGQTGEWDVHWEGKDDDGDGRINEDARGTLSLANDWSIRWDDKHEGANRFVMQLPETRALADFLIARPNLTAAFQLRGIGDGPEFAQGPKTQGKDPFERDKQLAAMLSKLWPDAKPGIKPRPEGPGSLLDWLYEAQGALAANLHLASLPGAKEEKKEEEGEEKPARRRESSDDEARQAAWLAYAPGDYLEWKAFKHPQLGDVEIGGWKLNGRSNPSEADATAGAVRVAEYLKAAIKTVPRLEVTKVEVQDKGEGLYRVRLSLHNAGALDYRTAFSADKRIHLPMFVSLKEIKEVELISGTRRQRLENLQAGGTATFEWLVRAGKDTPLQFDVESDRAAALTHKVAAKDCPAITTEDE